MCTWRGLEDGAWEQENCLPDLSKVLWMGSLLTALFRRIMIISSAKLKVQMVKYPAAKCMSCVAWFSICAFFFSLVLSLTETVTTLPLLGWQRRLKSMSMVQSFRMQWIFTTLRMKWPVIPKSGRCWLCIYTRIAFSVLSSGCFAFFIHCSNVWQGREGWKAGAGRELASSSEWDKVVVAQRIGYARLIQGNSRPRQ